MYSKQRIYMGLSQGKRVEMALRMCSLHGLIAGASGTGKTITIKAREEAADRRRAKIESQLISAGGQILKRGLMNTLLGGKR